MCGGFFFADLVTSMANVHVSAQMRRGIVERELGYYRGALRREVSIVFAVAMHDTHNRVFFRSRDDLSRPFATFSLNGARRLFAATRYFTRLPARRGKRLFALV